MQSSKYHKLSLLHFSIHIQEEQHKNLGLVPPWWIRLSLPCASKVTEYYEVKYGFWYYLNKEQVLLMLELAAFYLTVRDKEYFIRLSKIRRRAPGTIYLHDKREIENVETHAEWQILSPYFCQSMIHHRVWKGWKKMKATGMHGNLEYLSNSYYCNMRPV